MPFRKKPLTPKQHLILLRLSIVGVALWAFFFGALFPQTRYVGFWWSVTEAIFIGGAGVAVVGGLYWSRGTTAGAWTGLFVGSLLAVSGILADLYCRTGLAKGQDWMLFGWRLSQDNQFILNGVQVSFFSGIAACVCYAIVSLLTCKRPHDMDRMLNRGAYSAHPHGAGIDPANIRRRGWLDRILGIDEQFSRSDRWITLGIFWWSMTWFFVFIVGTVAYLTLRRRGHDSDYNGIWADYYLVTGIFMPLVIGAATTIWFTWGCTKDMFVFFRRLREEKIDIYDDGTVRALEAEDHSPDLMVPDDAPVETVMGNAGPIASGSQGSDKPPAMP